MKAVALVTTRIFDKNGKPIKIFIEGNTYEVNRNNELEWCYEVMNEIGEWDLFIDECFHKLFRVIY